MDKRQHGVVAFGACFFLLYNVPLEFPMFSLEGEGVRELQHSHV